MVIMQELFENFKITGSDIVEIAPMVRPPHIKQMEPETTLMVASSISTFLIQAMYGHP
jgi:agmatinase